MWHHITHVPENYKLWISGAVISGAMVLAARKLLASRGNLDTGKLVSGRCVLVTGGTSGVGKGIALEFSRQGANVVVTGRREERLKQVVSECRAVGSADGKYDYVVSDMEKIENISNLVQMAVEKLGGLDYVSMNHAWVDTSNIGFYGYTTEAYNNLRRQFDVNFFSCVKLLSEAMPHLRKSEGRVSVMCSLMGRIPELLISEHVATKFAMDGFFRSVDLENYFQETNVSITMIFPGFVDTSQEEGSVDSDPTAYEGLQEKLDFDIMGRSNDGCYNNKPGSVQDCARKLIEATARRDTELYFPKVTSTWWPVLKYHLSPNWMKNIIRNYRLGNRKN